MLTKMFVTNPSDPVSKDSKNLPLILTSCYTFYRLNTCNRTWEIIMDVDQRTTWTSGWSWNSLGIKSRSWALWCLRALMITPRLMKLQCRNQTNLLMVATETMSLTYLLRRSSALRPIANLGLPSVPKPSETGTKKRSSRLHSTLRQRM